MRKVEVYKLANRSEGRRERIVDFVGTFHQWGSNYEEFETGPGNFTVGIVEKATGEIKLVYAEMIKFID